jgi:hypothetical protein
MAKIFNGTSPLPYVETGQLNLGRIPNGSSSIKKGIWLYFWLLIFEGALRKWILPQLATPLLIVRDPVAVYVIGLAIYHNRFRINGYVIAGILITVFSFLTSLFFGHANITVALYGARIMIIQFPLLFVIGQNFNYNDALKMGRMIIYITPFMTILMAWQFYSPQSSWVNRGLGGDTSGAGFSGAMGFFRPPGTFSFITGLSAFYGLLAAYVLNFWLSGYKKNVDTWIFTLATICLFAAVPLSISRTLLFAVLLSLSFALVAALLNPLHLPKIIYGVGGIVLVLGVLSLFDFFQTAIEAFGSRFEVASSHEGGLQGTLGDRFLGGMIEAVSQGTDQRSLFWGKGLGMGTNAGAQLMSGKQTFLISEGEWGRLIGEMGLMLGVLAIILRVHFVVKMSSKAYSHLKKDNFLPWMLMSYAFVNILQGQWAQPNALGFSILSGGLIIASFKKPIVRGKNSQ